MECSNAIQHTPVGEVALVYRRPDLLNLSAFFHNAIFCHSRHDLGQPIEQLGLFFRDFDFLTIIPLLDGQIHNWYMVADEVMDERPPFSDSCEIINRCHNNPLPRCFSTKADDKASAIVG